MDSNPTVWLPPPDQVPLSEDAVHVWLLDLGRPPPASAWATLSDDERGRAERLRTGRRETYVSAQHQLRCVLSRYLDAAAQDLRFARGPHGKPYLAGPEGSTVRFNLSHSGDRALVAVTLQREVGVDLEYQRGVDALALARRFFSGTEAQAIAGLPSAQQQQALFFRLWTCKEALGKAAGIGIQGVLEGVQVASASNRWQSHVPALNTDQWLLLSLPPVPGYAASLALAAGTVELRCWSSPAHDRSPSLA